MTTTTTPTTTTPNPVDPLVGKETGRESSLSSWVGPYVTEMLGRGQALASQPYQSYSGPLSAGPSNLQTTAFSGLSSLTLPTDAQTSFTPGTFTAQTAQNYMNPYLTAALQPQIDEARRQAEISRQQQAGRMARAGAFGGSRQAIMEAELERGLGSRLADITGRGYQTAYDKAMDQFNREQALQLQSTGQAQRYGLDALSAQMGAGATQRDITQQGMAADVAQFKEERDYPYKQVQYMQSLLQGLPLAAQSISYQQPNALSELLGSAGGIRSLYDMIFGAAPAEPAPPPR